MAFIDELKTYLDKIPKGGEEAYKEAVEKVTRASAQALMDTLRSTTPRSSGKGGRPGRKHLVDTLVLEPVQQTSRRRKVGYVVRYDGYDDRGQPYQLIANSLNKAHPTNESAHFIDKAVRKNLKGMDKKIGEEFDRLLDQKVKEA